MKFIAEEARTKPVIYFGPKFDTQTRFNLPKDAFVKWVDYKDDRALAEVQDEAPDYSKGVVGLANEYGVGIDIRFQQDALVVIIQEHAPDYETCRQMVSRGVRSFGPQEGTLFTQGPSSSARHKKERLNREQGTDFLDGAAIIKVMKGVLNSRLSKEAK